MNLINTAICNIFYLFIFIYVVVCLSIFTYFKYNITNIIDTFDHNHNQYNNNHYNNSIDMSIDINILNILQIIEGAIIKVILLWISVFVIMGSIIFGIIILYDI